jgi:hypothetical protein
LLELDLTFEAIDDAEMISFSAYDLPTTEENAINFLEASQNLHMRLPEAANS